ncbi:MAG TPA: delta-60 repeat domain-containing protein, partial [Burkholderiales bacterium]
VQPDGRIVVVGHANLTANTSDIAVLRYNTNGTLDTAFGAGNSGIVVTDLGAFDNALSVALQPTDGKIVVSGNTIGATTISVVVLRYNTNGSLDATGFGAGGIVITPPIGPSNIASGNAVVVQPDGKIVAAGYD